VGSADLVYAFADGSITDELVTWRVVILREGALRLASRRRTTLPRYVRERRAPRHPMGNTHTRPDPRLRPFVESRCRRGLRHRLSGSL